MPDFQLHLEVQTKDGSCVCIVDAGFEPGLQLSYSLQYTVTFFITGVGLRCKMYIKLIRKSGADVYCRDLDIAAEVMVVFQLIANKSRKAA